MDKDSLKKIISHSKEYGFIFPSSEIYEGLNAVYDYAHNGSLLKNNIREYWWKSMVQLNDNIVGIDSAIFMHPKTWVASGHVDAFNDPLIDNKDSKKRYRADVLIEEHIEKLNLKIQKEINKAEKRFKEKFDKKQFIETSPRVKEILSSIEDIKSKMVGATSASFPGFKWATLRRAFIKIVGTKFVVCAVCGMPLFSSNITSQFP